MATVELTAPMRPNAGQAVVVRAVTVIMGTVVGLTFLFGFGNVLNLALRLGVPGWVAPLVAPAVDLSILGLLYWTTWRFRCRSTVLSEPACGLSTQSSPGRPSSGDAGATPLAFDLVDLCGCNVVDRGFCAARLAAGREHRNLWLLSR
jgi:hypothetical protein